MRSGDFDDKTFKLVIFEVLRHTQLFRSDNENLLNATKLENTSDNENLPMRLNAAKKLPLIAT